MRVASGREGVRRLPRFVLCVVEQKIHLRILERQRRESKRCCVYNGALRMVKELARCNEVGRARPSFAAEVEQMTKDEPMPDDEKIYYDAVEIERHPGRKHTRAELRKLRTALKNDLQIRRRTGVYAVFARDRFERRIAAVRRDGRALPVFAER